MKKYLLICIAFPFLLFISCKKSPETNKTEEVKAIENIIELVDEDTSFVLKKFNTEQIWPYNRNGRWGYINNADEFVIKPIFDGCGFFAEGFAWVKINGSYKIINSKGDYISESATFDAVGKAKDGIIPTKKGKLWGAVDTTANQIIDYNYEELKVLEKDLILIRKNRKWGLINSNGNDICLPVYDKEIIFKDDLSIVSRNYSDVGIINKLGKEIVKCQYDNVEILNDSIFKIAIKQGYNKRVFGLIINGKVKFPEEYSRIEFFHDSLLLLTKDSLSGILNMKGDTILPFKYNDLKAGNTNLLAAKAGEKWGYINLNSDTIIDFQFSEADAFKGELAIVYRGPHDRYNSKPENSSLINYKGETILPFENTNLKFLSNNLLMRSRYNYSINLFNKNGISIDSINYDSDQFNSPSDVITGYFEDPIEFYKFINGFAIIGHNGRVGMINEAGEIVIPLKYHHLEPMNEYGYTKAQYLDKYGIIDSEGNEIVAIGYDNIGYDDEFGLFYLQKLDDTNPKKKLINEGYWKYDGELLSDSPLKTATKYDLENQISKIRQAYSRIENESRKAKFSTYEIPNSNISIKENYNKMIVNDKNKGLRYEYFFDSSLNKYGPFFIFKVEGSKENRYYFDHGRIIRWLDEEKKDRLISDAIYSPEHEEHFRAREFKAIIANKDIREKYGLDIIKTNIDSLCELITSNIAKGIYKKGDSKSRSIGEYQTTNETYVDSLQNIMYKLDAGSDEGGSSKLEEFYYNGEIIREYSNKNYYDNSDNLPEAQWLSGQYALTKYYDKGDLIFTEKEKNRVMTVLKN
ncbi:hypothetical protein GCM10011506_18380 [Marivirga lumbricoides]|uniref:WG repeat-containing protein n=2 Tax=Marivirga lumbricoides TaxID=1046115 RepID=A0ABQ1M8F0_9BACT|nr:hypothetical protein GCM10011506_18380 [Marivirga lumbricoides]